MTQETGKRTTSSAPKQSLGRGRLALYILTVLLVLLALVLVVLTLLRTSVQPPPSPAEPLSFDEDAVVERLAAAIRLRTIAVDDLADFRGEPFLGLHDLLLRSYPCVHRVAKREVIADYSLLYTWTGTDPALAPGLMIAHSDVVPVEDPSAWSHPPFAGEVADGHIWGRGAHDDKAGIIVMFEAAEALCNAGFTPSRTLYFAIGHDEETRSEGAHAVATVLAERNVQADFLVDEGLMITEGVLPGLKAPLALIGIAEKGFVTAKLAVELADGHSSMPPPQSAIGILAAGIARLEAKPFSFDLRPPMRDMLDTLAPEMPFGRRLVLSNLWLLRPLVIHSLAGSDRTRSLLHTTTAITVMHGGIKENVLPKRAHALVNFRLLPGDTVDQVITRTRKILDDPRIEVSIHGTSPPSDPSAIADTQSPAYAALAQAIRAVRPEVIVSPALMIAHTDSTQYANIVDNTYRFRPIHLSDDEIASIHGSNEGIRREALLDGVRIYAEFIRRAAGPDDSHNPNP
ncbi:MAG TPA: M20/M25/M40 family metallo-hydrolase [Nannocystis exedens]|nr:M20/M25/M40 family metallo-hydrolase [Nannocystis exedens]